MGVAIEKGISWINSMVIILTSVDVMAIITPVLQISRWVDCGGLGVKNRMQSILKRGFT